MADLQDQQSIEDLYETLATTIDDVRGEMTGESAREIEGQFLAKLAFLALREISDGTRRKELIRIAGWNLR